MGSKPEITTAFFLTVGETPVGEDPLMHPRGFGAVSDACDLWPQGQPLPKRILRGCGQRHFSTAIIASAKLLDAQDGGGKLEVLGTKDVVAPEHVDWHASGYRRALLTTTLGMKPDTLAICDGWCIQMLTPAGLDCPEIQPASLYRLTHNKVQVLSLELITE